MASTSTGATSSTSTSTSSNRKRMLPSDSDPPPRPKKQKKQTNLDTLKVELQEQVGYLKDNLINVREFFLGEGVAKKDAKRRYYIALLSECNAILKGKNPTLPGLAMFQLHFPINFESEEVLRSRMSQNATTLHNSMLSNITSLLSKTAQLIEVVLTELTVLPEPSEYAHHATWRVWQKKHTAVLNLRPRANQGLPIETLHPVFATFLNDVRLMRLDDWAPEEDANTASIDICKAMADSFDNDTTRCTMLKELLHRLGLDLQTDYYILHSARTGPRKAVFLGEIKAEFESGDPYMQVSRSYQGLVHHLKRQGQGSDGVPCILLAVCGPLLMVAAGFSDGEHTIVEPLAQPCMMLPSRYNHRERLLAHILFFTRKAVQELQQPSTTKLSPPGMPRVYPTYLNSSGINVDLEFIKLLGPSSLHRHPNPTLLFLAKNPADSESSLLVKLVAPECYGETVHHTLAERGLAPLLHGTACVAGAPSAIVMDYLDANSGWMTLQNYIKEHQEITINTEHPRLVEVLETMKAKGFVHGDLRPINIMCREQPGPGKERGELEIKVIDFDRAGSLGVARYPAGMNPDIPWPGNPRGLIGGDDDEKLLSKTLAKLYSCSD